MGVNKYVFPSRSEKENYKKLLKQWSDKYLIYHNLPFLNIFNFNDIIDIFDKKGPKPIRITWKEKEYLKKTSVDYIICDVNDSPILCLEFDGMQQGHNFGTTYAAGKVTDHHAVRKRNMELKLKIAHASNFPFFVVRDIDFNYLSEEHKLMIVDAIIGEVLTRKAISHAFNKGFDPEELGISEESFSKLQDYEKHDIIQDWALGIEVISEMENNPVLRKSSELHRKHTDEINSWSEAHLQYPWSREELKEKNGILNINDDPYYGGKVILSTKHFGEITATVWLPNYKAPSYSGITLSIEIAKLLTFVKLDSLRNKA